MDTLHLNKQAESLGERHAAHQSETTKRYLIKNIEASDLSPGDKRALVKIVRSQ